MLVMMTICFCRCAACCYFITIFISDDAVCVSMTTGPSSTRALSLSRQTLDALITIYFFLYLIKLRRLGRVLTCREDRLDEIYDPGRFGEIEISWSSYRHIISAQYLYLEWQIKKNCWKVHLIAQTSSAHLPSPIRQTGFFWFYFLRYDTTKKRYLSMRVVCKNARVFFIWHTTKRAIKKPVYCCTGRLNFVLARFIKWVRRAVSWTAYLSDRERHLWALESISIISWPHDRHAQPWMSLSLDRYLSLSLNLSSSLARSVTLSLCRSVCVKDRLLSMRMP